MALGNTGQGGRRCWGEVGEGGLGGTGAPGEKLPYVPLLLGASCDSKNRDSGWEKPPRESCGEPVWARGMTKQPGNGKRDNGSCSAEWGQRCGDRGGTPIRDTREEDQKRGDVATGNKTITHLCYVRHLTDVQARNAAPADDRDEYVAALAFRVDRSELATSARSLMEPDKN